MKKGATIRYILSEDATVRLSIERKLKGVKLSKTVKRKTTRRCVTSTKRNRKKLTSQINKRLRGKSLSRKAKRRRLARDRRKAKCTMYRKKGELKRSGHRGRNSTSFTGRIGSRRLARGRYRLTVTATDTAGNVSVPKKKSFQIVRAR